MSTSPIHLVLPALLLALGSLPAQASEPLPTLLVSEIIEAKSLTRVEPKYPISAARKGQEGWTVLSFIIEADGSVSSPIIEDSSGNRMINNASLRAVKEWQYTPATENGKAVQQCNQSVRLDFTLAGDNQGATRKFVRKYKEINQLVNDKNLNEAKEGLDRLKSKPRWNLYEDAWYYNLLAAYHRANGDKQGQLSALNRVISAKNYIPSDIRTNALVNAFSLNLSLSNLASGIANAKQLEKIEGNEQVVAKLAPYLDKIDALVASDKLLIKQGKIEEDSAWHHKLMRSSFALTEVTGDLHKLEVRCNNKVFTYQVSEDRTWVIPDKWGQCNVYIHGADDTSFKLVEVPSDKPLKVEG